jgi:mono/diheme cytochrome c family protein
MMKFVYILPVFLLLLGLSNDEWEASIARGEELYMDYCITCHMAEGEGIEGLYPPLAKSDYLMEDLDRAIGVVKNGLGGEIVVNGQTYNSYMPAPGLEDQEIADILNFVLSNWGNETDSMITAGRVSEH